MIHIEELVPYYICNKEKYCSTLGGCGDDMCNHTAVPHFARNDAAIFIFEQFADTFNLDVDENGRLICTEKEKKE